MQLGTLVLFLALSLIVAMVGALVVLGRRNSNGEVFYMDELRGWHEPGFDKVYLDFEESMFKEGRQDDPMRDRKEEMANSMIFYEEHMLRTTWTFDRLIHVITRRFMNATLETDDSGQIVVYTGLYEAPDGTIWRDHPDAV